MQFNVQNKKKLQNTWWATARGSLGSCRGPQGSTTPQLGNHWYTGSAKLMVTHILTWFLNKNEENWKFIAAAYSQITCKSIHLSFIQYVLLYFLIICFSLPWKALHDAHRTSWGIKAYSRCNLVSDSWENHKKLGRSCSRGWTTPKSSKDSGPTPWGPAFLADKRRDVGLNPPLGHSWVMWGRRVLLEGPRCFLEVLSGLW